MHGGKVSRSLCHNTTVTPTVKGGPGSIVGFSGNPCTGATAKIFAVLQCVLLMSTSGAQQREPVANFVDIAKEAGLTAPVTFGGETSKKYIIETTGTGVAILDYD